MHTHTHVDVLQNKDNLTSTYYLKARILGQNPHIICFSLSRRYIQKHSYMLTIYCKCNCKCIVRHCWLKQCLTNPTDLDE